MVTIYIYISTYVSDLAEHVQSDSQMPSLSSESAVVQNDSPQPSVKTTVDTLEENPPMPVLSSTPIEPEAIDMTSNKTVSSQDVDPQSSTGGMMADNTAAATKASGCTDDSITTDGLFNSTYSSGYGCKF